jgi:biopolymer transport protein ExbD
MQTLFGQKSFGRKGKKASEELSLQIVSMADIFTIILVFLLKTASSGIISESPNFAALPIANGQALAHDTLKVEISKGSVLIDDKNVLWLDNFNLPLTEVQAGGMSQSIYQVLSDQRKHLPNANNASELLILADEDTPYSTLKTVLASAANSGFVDLQLVVVQPE